MGGHFCSYFFLKLLLYHIGYTHQTLVFFLILHKNKEECMYHYL